MKRLTFLLALAFSFTSLFAQPLPDPTETGPTALEGLRESITVYSPPIDGYWDVSTQIKSTFAGLGDSTNLSVATWQSNDRDQDAWTLVTTDTLATVTDEAALLLEITDFTGVWLKYVILSLSLDSMSIETYQVKKKFKLF
ncbi:hypothetical protein LCGC14_2301330 [marine sediment metagenome]|uniref:Uncharacterized protein n=1 Tax=marine sediment metagenome TaxID=412755 RepID=A0A0F9F0U0_9ZZZZ